MTKALAKIRTISDIIHPILFFFFLANHNQLTGRSQERFRYMKKTQATIVVNMLARELLFLYYISVVSIL